MSGTFEQIVALIEENDFLVSDHAYQELQNDGLVIADLARGVPAGVLLEDYPDFHKGPSVLVLSKVEGVPVHSVWGLVKGQNRPAWLITAYRPVPKKWMPNWKTRREA